MARNYGLSALAIFALAALAYVQFAPQPRTDTASNAPSKEQISPKQNERAHANGDFDFYVLALSWSPSFCASEGSNRGQQCDANQEFGFVVHGLWPQNQRGYPQFCDSSEPDRVPEQIGRSMFDIMPSMGLIGHQWRKHGTCTGLNQEDYFSSTRQAYEAVTIPPEFVTVSQEKTLNPAKIEQSFMASNPGLKADQIAVTCSNGMINEVRICMSRTFGFQSCPEVNQKSCRAKSASLPPQ